MHLHESEVYGFFCGGDIPDVAIGTLPPLPRPISVRSGVGHLFRFLMAIAFMFRGRRCHQRSPCGPLSARVLRFLSEHLSPECFERNRSDSEFILISTGADAPQPCPKEGEMAKVAVAKKEVSAVRRVRTKQMPVAEAVDIAFIRGHTPSVSGARVIGVWHRHKQLERTDKETLDNAEGIDTEVVGESPTIITVGEKDGTMRTFPCASVEEELNFLFGVLPIAHREVTEFDRPEHFIAEHIRYEVVKDDALWATVPEHQRKVTVDEKKGAELRERMSEVPAEYDGLMQGDTVLATMGGSGGTYVQALARQARTIGARVLHISPIRVKYYRMAKYGDLELTKDGEVTLVGKVRLLSRQLTKLGEGIGEADVVNLIAMREELRTLSAKAEAMREKDAEHLIELYAERPDLFLPVMTFHAAFTYAGECFRVFIRAQEARKAEQLRLIAQAKAALYTHPEGIYPVGGIASYTEAYLEGNVALSALRTAENEDKKRLEKALADSRLERLMEMYKEEFGFFGPRLFGALCAKVGTFARFKDEWAWNKYVGTHVNDDGTFVRRGRGLGDDSVRQEIWLMVTNVIKKSNLPWRPKYDTHKANIRVQYPLKVIDPKTGKSRWSDIHVHKTAMWKTATDIALALWKIGRAWEREMSAQERGQLPEGTADVA